MSEHVEQAHPVAPRRHRVSSRAVLGVLVACAVVAVGCSRGDDSPGEAPADRGEQVSDEGSTSGAGQVPEVTVVSGVDAELPAGTQVTVLRCTSLDGFTYPFLELRPVTLAELEAGGCTWPEQASTPGGGDPLWVYPSGADRYELRLVGVGDPTGDEVPSHPTGDGGPPPPPTVPTGEPASTGDIVLELVVPSGECDLVGGTSGQLVAVIRAPQQPRVDLNTVSIC